MAVVPRPRRIPALPTLALALTLTLGACEAGPGTASLPDSGKSFDRGWSVAAPDARATDGALGSQTQRTPCEAVPALCAGPASPAPRFDGLETLVPSPGLPPEVSLRQSNNNLDLTWFEGRFFLAFRTASHHHPRADATLYVLSSADLSRWDFEQRIVLGTDLREPQLVSLGPNLLLYFAVVAPENTNFVPLGVRVSRRLGPTQWTPPRSVLEPGLVPWRMRSSPEGLELLGYVGVKGLLDNRNAEVKWLKSRDGETFEPVVPGQPTVLRGGVSETDLARLSDGAIVAVSRNETGDATGFGSKLCRAEATALGQWRCAPDRRKYDSPLVFRHGETVYLVGRRHVTEDGLFDLGQRLLPWPAQLALYEASYWLKPKRCALWRVDPEALAVTHLLDLPSRGDTCFPEVLPLDARRYLLLNYSSPLDGPDLSWKTGQDGRTLIYRGVLTLP